MSDEIEIPRTDEPLRRLGAGAAAGLVLAGVDLWLAPRYGGSVAPPPREEQWAVLGILPCLGLVAAFVAMPLTGVRRILVPAAVAWWTGKLLAEGPRASEMLLADYWHWIGGVGMLFLAWAWYRGDFWRWPLAVAIGALIYWRAAETLRGQYRDLREAAVGFAGICAFAMVMPIVGRLPRLFAGLLVLIGLAGGASGYWATTRSQDAVDWAWRATTADASWAGRFRGWLTGKEQAPEAANIERVPFFGTDTARASFGALGKPPRGVLLVLVDAVRADTFRGRRNGRPMMPWLEAQAERSVVFNRAQAPSTASHMSLFSAVSGLYPSRIVKYPEGVNAVPLVTERMKAAGVVTRAAFPKMVHNARTAGFRRFDMGFEHTRIHGDDDLTTDDAFAAVRPAQSDARWFSYVHICAPHAPYDDAPEGYAIEGDERDRYDGEILWADELTRRLVARFEEAGLLDDAWLVIASDHGEEFGEHGEVRHGRQLFVETVHVPLIVRAPGLAARAVDAPVSLTDLAPTLDHAFALPDAGRPDYDGRSLVPFLTGLDDPGRLPWAVAEIPPLDSAFLAVQSAVVGERWKLIVDHKLNRRYLFDHASDPAEYTNLADDEPRKVNELWSVLLALKGVHAGDEAPEPDPWLDYLALADDPAKALGAARELIHAGDVTPKPMIARSLCCLAADGDVEVALVLDNHFKHFDDPLVEQGLSVLRYGASLEQPGDRDTMVRLFETTRDPFVVTGILLACITRADEVLLEKPLPAVEHQQELVEVAQQAYFGALIEEREPDHGLLLGAARNTNPWIARVGVRGLTTNPGVSLHGLYEILGRAKSPRLRAALFRAVHTWVNTDVGESMRREVFDSDGWSSRVAFGLYAKQTRENLHVVREVSSEIELPASPAGAVIGLKMRAKPRLAPRPTVHLQIGGWTHAVEVPRGHAVPPLRVPVPDRVTGRTLQIRMDPAQAPDVVFEGLLLLTP